MDTGSTKLDVIMVAVDELTHFEKRLDRAANRPPALLYAHLMDCIKKEPHMESPW
jgi:hypothetical protein